MKGFFWKHFCHRENGKWKFLIKVFSVMLSNRSFRYGLSVLVIVLLIGSVLTNAIRNKTEKSCQNEAQRSFWWYVTLNMCKKKEQSLLDRIEMVNRKYFETRLLKNSDHCKYLIAPMMLLAFMILLGINRYSSNRGDGFENLRLVSDRPEYIASLIGWNPLWNFRSDAEFKHLLREMEASGLKTGSIYQKSDHGSRNRRHSKPRSSKGQFKSKAAKLSYRRAPKQTSGRRTISLLQAVNEAVKSAKVWNRSIQVKWGQIQTTYFGIRFFRHSIYCT